MAFMRQLQWEELDVVQALEGLRLLLTLWPEGSVVDVTLWSLKTDSVLLDFTVAVRGRLRYNNDQRGQYLEFPDCVLVSRISFSREQDEAAFNPNVFGRPLLVTVRPHLSVLFE